MATLVSAFLTGREGGIAGDNSNHPDLLLSTSSTIIRRITPVLCAYGGNSCVMSGCSVLLASHTRRQLPLSLFLGAFSFNATISPSIRGPQASPKARRIPAGPQGPRTRRQNALHFLPAALSFNALMILVIIWGSRASPKAFWTSAASRPPSCTAGRSRLQSPWSSHTCFQHFGPSLALALQSALTQWPLACFSRRQHNAYELRRRDYWLSISDTWCRRYM